MKLSIIVVNWNGEKILAELFPSLESVIRQVDGLEVIVVDNGSSDNSEIILKEYEHIFKIIRSSDNLGFARGCNLGAINSRGDYLLFLNPDTVLNGSAVEAILEVFERPENVDVGIVGVQIRDQNDSIMRTSARFPRAYMFLSHNMGLTKIFKKLSHNMAEWDHRSDRTVDQVIGAFFAVRADLFKKLNGFDEDFFVYFEEVDFSIRSAKQGFRTLYLSNVFIVHEGGGASNRVKARRLFYILRSRLIYGKKHFNLIENYLNIFNLYIVEPFARILFLITTRRSSEISDILEAYSLLHNHTKRHGSLGRDND